MGYRANISLTIFDEKGESFASGWRDIELPFVPYPGLTIIDEVANSFEIARVEWNIRDQFFVCSVEDREQWVDADFIDIQFLIDEAKRSGFKGFRKIIRMDK